MSLQLGHVGAGTYEPLQVLGALALALAYAIRARTLAGRGAPVPIWRQVSFAAGVAIIVVSLVSPLDHLSDELVLAHMVQHLFIGDIAAVLVVLGLTGPMLQPVLAIRWLAWIRTLAHPLIAFPIWVATLYIWHVPALYQEAVASAPVHAAQHASFIGAGFLMSMALLGPLPKPAWFGFGAKIAYIAAVRLAGAVLGNVFMWSGTVLYPDYAGGEAFWGLSPLTDQGTAGVIMMLESTILTVATLAWLFLRWAKEDTERQHLVELAEARGIPLDPARARRAVAAGEGARLQRKLMSDNGGEVGDRRDIAGVSGEQ